MEQKFKKVVPLISGLAVLATNAIGYAAVDTRNEGIRTNAEAMGTSSVPISPLKKKFGHIPNQGNINTDKVATDVSTVVNATNIEKPVIKPKKETAKEYEGHPISNVRLVGFDNVSKETVYRVLKLQRGSKFSLEGVKEDASAIYSLGYFQEVRPNYRFIRTADGKDEKVEVSYTVVEYPVIQDIVVEGSTLIDKFRLARLLNTQRTVPNMLDVTKKLGQVMQEYKNKGYILAGIKTLELTPNGILHVVINEGTIEGYNITGNKHTKKYVIERELRQKPGEPFNEYLMKRSVQRLNNLGFFEDVEVQLAPGKNPGSVVVGVEVYEQNTGTVGIGAGYSDSDGLVGQLTYSEKNFLGTGSAASATWEFGGRDNFNYNLSYSKPWIDKKETRMTVNLYRGTHEFTDYNRDGYEIADYDKRSTGEEITFSRAEGEFVRNAISFKHRKDSYRGPVGGGQQYFEDGYQGETYGLTAEERRKENFGETRSISISRTYDNRDSVFDPHHGKMNKYQFEWAGFGGDFNYQKLSAEHRYYWELNPKTKHVLALQVAAGYSWGNMPLSQRFSVGGGYTLRGYRDNQFRGNSMLRASLEYRIPISKRVSFLAFLDEGYAWDKRDERNFDLSKLKTGYGVGLRFQTPIGPVRLDYGIGKERKRFHFSFGGSF